MQAAGKKLQKFAQYCRGAGLKVTHQRTEIYRELIARDIHPDAETIHERVRKRIPAISLDTVCRTLRMMEAAGIVSRVGSAGDRARFDANTDRHHHFLCTVCGRVEDFCSDILEGFRPPPAVRAAGKLESVYVELRGRCCNCRKR